MLTTPRFACLALLTALLPGTAPVRAQTRDVPYWASIRVDEVNMRVGPGEDYAINWVYRRPLLPVKVLRLKEGWRLVQDPAGERGWMLARFLSRQRGAIVAGKDAAAMREKAGADSRLLWRLEPGVTGKLDSCDAGWCRIEIGERAGYVAQDQLWGAGEP